ncbi:MAG: 2-oxo acid dehydrogenase subunit E2 [Gemmatimonadaceae bacterium]|nr:2-oxo acid dehydrogenase subunit E2 [Gemmatimonadaceae bacterium]
MLASPLARRMASERGLDIGQVQGSGPGGRIIKRDVEEAMAARRRGHCSAGARPAAPGITAADFTDAPLTQIRKTIARRLAESIGPVPTFYLTAEFDLARVTDMRAAMAAIGPEFKVSVNDIILKAVAIALTQHPEVNAHWLGDKHPLLHHRAPRHGRRHRRRAHRAGDLQRRRRRGWRDQPARPANSPSAPANGSSSPRSTPAPRSPSPTSA